MSATTKKGGLLGLVNFKIKNPINSFKATFKKHIEQQCNHFHEFKSYLGILAKATFLHLVIQVLNMVFLYLTKTTLCKESTCTFIIFKI